MRGLFGALVAPGRKDALTLDTLPGFLLASESKTGISVTWSTALQVTAMLACARVVGEGIAQSRCRLFRPRPKGGLELATGHRLNRLLFLEPSKGRTAFGFWETVVFHVMFVGNAFAFINWVAGDVYELLLLEPGKVRVTQLPDRSLAYEVQGPGGVWQRMPAGVIWHIPGPSWNGWMGMETIKLAREALGLSLALEASHAEMHKDGVKASGAYAIDGELTIEQHGKMVTWLKRYAAAGDLAGAPLILDRGAKWLAQQMSGVDSQHLETRKFQIEEVCRAVRVMPIMVGSSDKAATYASAEQMFLAHVTHTLAPWAGRLEQAIEVALLTDEEKDQGFAARFNLSALMRGDFKSRQDGLQVMRRNGVINANEWRELEDWAPREDDGGPQYVVESNMTIQDGRDLPAKPTVKEPAKEA